MWETFQVLGNWTGVGWFERLRGESTHGPSPSCTTVRSGRPIDPPHVDYLNF